MNRSVAVWAKACLVWLLLLAAAAANGALRDLWLHPLFGYATALPLSGVILSVLIFLLTWLCIPWFGRQTAKTHLLIGTVWVGLTLAFEFGFGHFARGESWQALLRLFDLPGGNLFTVALLTALVSPLLTARLRGTVETPSRRGI